MGGIVTSTLEQSSSQRTMDDWTDEQLDGFRRDGFLVVEHDFLDAETVERLRERFARLFAGEYETGIQPDEVKWVPGRDPEDQTRQVCNVWKADRTFGSQLLSTRTGRLVASLMGWDGVRVLQDVCIWKPPRAAPLPMHRDGARLGYIVPSESVTCWIALDRTSREAGAITYARGSHLWPQPGRRDSQVSDDWLEPAKAAMPAECELELVTPAVEAGGAIFHRHDTLHGYGPNTEDVTSRGVITHFAHADTRFHSSIANPVYSRYRRVGDTSLDESFFPIVWARNGGRSSWLDEYSDSA
jgi:ectoine hydroxylase-related dioxygenase (phytanoyl-CoA dioxygenase family)